MDTNHILLPTTYFEVQNPIMNISLNIQMKTTHNKNKMKLVKKNDLSLNIYQTTPFSIQSLHSYRKQSNLISFLIFECQNNPPFGQFALFVFHPFFKTIVSLYHWFLLIIPFSYKALKISK